MIDSQTNLWAVGVSMELKLQLHVGKKFMQLRE